MKKVAQSLLRSLLVESEPIRRLPLRVVHQLVGYYGDWRRSRDIISDLDDAANAPRVARLFNPVSSSNSFHAS